MLEKGWVAGKAKAAGAVMRVVSSLFFPHEAAEGGFVGVDKDIGSSNRTFDLQAIC